MHRPQFCPPKEVVETAFAQMTHDIDWPEAIRATLLEQFDQGLVKGDTDWSAEEMEATLKTVDWQWPWFDEWAARFKEREDWPYMWADGCLDEDPPSAPSTLEEASEFLLVKQMRSLLKSKGITTLPTKRSEVEQLFRNTMNLEEAAEQIQKRLDDLLSDYRVEHHRQRCRLLVHTIQARTYILRRAMDYIALSEDSTQTRYMVLEFSGDDTLEEEIAQELGDQVWQQLPPLFPGDRTRIRLKRQNE
ncbi:hypothetical protein DLM_1278 [Aquitalea magnusonii]|uniref:Uncharacterized protein n=1 Tax=Aquitalea magnusonii TaxID=332411 RepID=A0A3G9GFL7_9NEIS|nr:hypothetical protein [Aquitalea magnusonii]BBF84902.1 hypothetical protein DLM_1278 [Aquitalea magnusonii]